MSGKIEYLEKYSVAPSPSRDYYGLKVLRDEVILYIWKISHGPHKTPLSRTAKFIDFEQNKSLQDDIERGFGERLLIHVRNIARGDRNTLLTLPKCLIENLTKYLTIKDIAKLSSLSHVAYEVFNDNTVWKVLYNQSKSVTSKRFESISCTVHNWKQLYKQEEMQALIKEQTYLRTRPTTKQIRAKPKKDESRSINVPPKSISKAISAPSVETKKPVKAINKKTKENSSTKRSSDIRLDGSAVISERPMYEKRAPLMKSLQLTNQKSAKISRGKSATLKNELECRAESKDLISNKSKSTNGQTKVRRGFANSRSSESNIRLVENKVNLAQSKTSLMSKINKSEKPARATQSAQTKGRTKVGKKTVGQSKSTILSTDQDLIRNSSKVRDDSFDLADLIEASLKNIRSPRNIFDYDFSSLEKSNSGAGDVKTYNDIRKNVEIMRGMKINYPTLDRLSEKSEPLTAKSKSSTKLSPTDLSNPLPMTGSSVKGKTNKACEKSADYCEQNKCSSVSNEKTIDFDHYNFKRKYSKTNNKSENIMQEKYSVPKKPLDRMDVLRSLRSNKTIFENKAPTAFRNRVESKMA